MPAGYINLLIEGGSTFSTIIALTNSDGTPMDLSGMIGSAKMRKSYYWAGNVYPLTVIIDAPSTAGRIILSASASETSTFSPGRYYYDLEIENGGIVTRVIEGIVEVRPNATK